MPTKRRPLKRSTRTKFTPDVIAAFLETERLSFEGAGTNDDWWNAHNRLHDLLRCKPWQWPCIEYPDSDPHDSLNPEQRRRGLKLYADLSAAAK